MNILFFTHYFPPEVNAPASRTHEMCKRWVENGHSVTVITCAPNAPDGVLYNGYRNRFRHREEYDGIHVIRVWTFLAANKGSVKRMLNYFSYMFSAFFQSMFIDRPDVVIATSPQLFCGWAGALCAMFRRRVFIIEMRDMFTESVMTLTSVKKGLLERILHWMEFSLYRRGRKLVTVGPGYRRRLIEEGIPEDHIEVVTNGVDRDFFDPNTDGSKFRLENGLAGKFVVTYAGTIGMAHGLEVVLEAARRLQKNADNRVVFLLAGDGATREQLQNQASEENLDSIRFLGKLPKLSMPQLLAGSDVCLVHLRKAPLYTSVLPSKIFEMSHMRKPIILGVEGDAAEVLTSSGGGICIEPGNVVELLDAVTTLQEDAELRIKFGECGHRFVAEHFDRNRLAEKYLHLIEKIVAEKK